MTETSACPPLAAHGKPSFARDLFDTILSYMKWGYGGLLLSIIAYGIYELAIGLDRWLVVSGVRIQFVAWTLTSLILSAAFASVVSGVLLLRGKFKGQRGNFASAHFKAAGQPSAAMDESVPKREAQARR